MTQNDLTEESLKLTIEVCKNHMGSGSLVQKSEDSVVDFNESVKVCCENWNKDLPVRIESLTDPESFDVDLHWLDALKYHTALAEILNKAYTYKTSPEVSKFSKHFKMKKIS